MPTVWMSLFSAYRPKGATLNTSTSFCKAKDSGQNVGIANFISAGDLSEVISSQ